MLTYPYTVSYIIYSQIESVQKVMKSADQNIIFYANTIENPVDIGYPLLCAEYNRSFPNVKNLQASINHWMENFDQKSETTDQAEDGWMKVGKKKTQRVTEEEQNEVKRKINKKRKKNELVSLSKTKSHKKCFSLGKLLSIPNT
mgnify:CR=1 FL=1